MEGLSTHFYYINITSSMQFKKTQPQNTEQVWKVNDAKAQKNGSHSNIYWVRVNH